MTFRTSPIETICVSSPTVGANADAGARLRIGSACLVRYAPGALVDERELNQRAREETLVALREQKAQQSNFGVNFVRYLQGLARGDLGFSESNHSSVSALLADRAPRTLRDLSFGLALAWLVGLGCAMVLVRFPLIWSLDVSMLAVATLILSLPARADRVFLSARRAGIAPGSGYRAGAENLSIFARRSHLGLCGSPRRDGAIARRFRIRYREGARFAGGCIAIDRPGGSFHQPGGRRRDTH